MTPPKVLHPPPLSGAIAPSPACSVEMSCLVAHIDRTLGPMHKQKISGLLLYTNLCGGPEVPLTMMHPP